MLMMRIVNVFTYNIRVYLEEWLCSRWKGLVDTYRRKIKEDNVSGAAGGGSKSARWIFYSEMSFIKPYITARG